MKLTIGGIEMHYDLRGSGSPTLVFVHGGESNGLQWERQLEALSGQFRTLAPDLRGNGYSTKVGPFTIEQHASDLVELLDKLEIQRCVVIGGSRFGCMGLELAQRIPDKVVGVVIASGRLTVKPEHAQRLLRTAADPTLTTERIADVIVEGLLAARSVGTGAEWLKTAIRLQVRMKPLETTREQLAVAATYDHRACVPHVRCPVMICWGTEDRVCGPVEAAELRRAFPQARIHAMADTGHDVSGEQFARFNAHLLDFVTSLI